MKEGEQNIDGPPNADFFFSEEHENEKSVDPLNHAHLKVPSKESDRGSRSSHRIPPRTQDTARVRAISEPVPDLNFHNDVN